MAILLYVFRLFMQDQDRRCLPTLIGQLPQLAALVEKLGIIGVLLLVVGWLIYERMRLMKLSVKAFRQRERARALLQAYMTACKQANIVVDVSHIDAIFAEETAEG